MCIPNEQVSTLTLLMIALVLSLAGCRATTEGLAPAAKGSTKDEDVAAIKARHAGKVAALNARDASAIVALETDDALFMAPDEPTRVGKEAIKS